MYDHDICWYSFVPLALLIAGAALLAETAGWWGHFPARPDWLWGLAFYAGLKAPPNPAIMAFFLCGLIRDLVLGPKLGSATLAFTFIGWITLYWRPLAATRGWFYQPLVAGLSAFLLMLMKHALDYGPLTYKLLERWFFVSLVDGVLTGMGYLPLMLVLGLASLRPWKDREGY